MCRKIAVFFFYFLRLSNSITLCVVCVCVCVCMRLKYSRSMATSGTKTCGDLVQESSLTYSTVGHVRKKPRGSFSPQPYSGDILVVTTEGDSV